MRYEDLPIIGHIQAIKIHKNGFREVILDRFQNMGTSMFSNLRSVLISRSVEYGVDAMAWGSFKASAGTFIDSDWAGTTSTGTKGALVQASVGSLLATFSGTFSFSSTKQINGFFMGRGYTPAAGGVTQLFTSIYNYDFSLLTGSTFVSFDNGDSLVVNWSNQVGS